MNTTLTTSAGPRSITLPLADPLQRSADLAYWEKNYHPLDWMSNSKATCFARCPRRYLYRHGYKLQPIGGFGNTGRRALDYGTAMHKAIPVILSGGTLQEAYEQFISFWETTSHNDMADEKRNHVIAAKALQKFQLDRANSLFVLEKPPQGIQAPIQNPEDRSPWELRFAVMLPNTSILYTGFLDAIARHKYNRVLYVDEFKTTSQLGGTFLNSWPLNPQLSGYSYALQLLYGEPVGGAIVEGIQSAKTKQDNVQIEQRVTQQTIADWVVQTSYITQQIQSMEAAKDFPKMTTGCNPYPMFGGHGYKCEYMSLCQSDNWQDSLPLYNTVTDDPYDLSRGQDLSEPV